MESQKNQYEQWFEYTVNNSNYTKEFKSPARRHLCSPYDTRKILWAGLRTFLGEDKAKWLPCYTDVARWLSDNERRGLICVGPCGLGKSLICTRIFPVLFSKSFNVPFLSFSAVEMNTSIDKILDYCGVGNIIIIDDLGTEAAETISYGNRRRPFCELADRAERTGTMLIITTNLRTDIQRLAEDGPFGHKGDPDPRRIPSIEERYGIRTLDRLRASTRAVLFRGESMRN